MYHHQSGWALEPTDRMVRWHQHPKSGHFSSGPWLAGTRIYPFWIFGDKGDGGGGNNWSYTMRKAPVKMSPPTNQHPVVYRPDALPHTQPTVSKH